MGLYKLNNVWIKDNKLRTSTKIKLNKSLVKSVLLYNRRTWTLTLTKVEKLHAYPQKQLKKILSIRYPPKITIKLLIIESVKKVTVITNSIGSLESLWSYSKKRQ